MLFEKEEFIVWYRAAMMIINFYRRYYGIPTKPDKAKRRKQESRQNDGNN